MTLKYSDSAVLVFAKAPIAGEVNTRLIPDIGIDAATQLQAELIHSRLNALQKNKLCHVELWCSPDSDHEFFQKCKDKYGVPLFSQQGDDLGMRMSLAIKEALKRFERVVLIGTDAPSLKVDQIELAIQKLADDVVVISPAEDGGYVLIGMSQYYSDIFNSVPWGTKHVLRKTKNNIEVNGLCAVELNTCWDIDRLEDYRRYKNPDFIILK